MKLKFLLVTVVALALSPLVDARECPEWLTTEFDAQLTAALGGNSPTAKRDVLEKAVEAVFEAHFSENRMPFNSAAVRQTIIKLDVDYVGRSALEMIPPPEIFSIEFQTNSYYRARYEVLVGSASVSHVTRVEEASGASAGKRLYRVKPVTQAAALNEFTNAAAKPGFKIINLSHELAAVLPATVNSRRSFILEYLSTDMSEAHQVIGQLNLETSAATFATSFLELLEQRGFWKESLNTKLDKLSDVSKSYVQEPFRAVRPADDEQYLRENLARARKLTSEGDLTNRQTLNQLGSAIGALYAIPARDRGQIVKKAFGYNPGAVIQEGKPTTVAFGLVEFWSNFKDKAGMEKFLKELEVVHFATLE